MRSLARLSFALVSLLLMASPARADMRSGAVELGVFSGAYHLTEDDTDFDTRSFVTSFRAGLLITREHEVEVAFDSVEVELAGIKFEEIESWNVRYLYNFDLGRRAHFVPYVGGGLGNVEDDVVGVASDDATQLTLFGGLRGFAGRVFAVRGEMALKTFDTFEVDQTVVEVTAGVAFVVGGRAGRGAGPY